MTILERGTTSGAAPRRVDSSGAPDQAAGLRAEARATGVGEMGAASGNQGAVTGGPGTWKTHAGAMFGARLTAVGMWLTAFGAKPTIDVAMLRFAARALRSADAR